MSLSSMADLRTLLRPLVHAHRCRRGLKQIAKFLSVRGELLEPTMYDVGARWGVSPPYDQLVVFHGFRSVGFEPDATEAEELRKRNAFTHICPVALGARSENRTLHIAKDPGSSSLHRANAVEMARHTDWRLYETVRDVSVPVEPLDSVVAKYGLPSPDYLKLDCEGAEAEVLDGAADAIRHLWGITFEARICNLYLDNSANLSELLDRMFRAGFVCLRIDP